MTKCKHCEKAIEERNGVWWDGGNFQCPDGETDHTPQLLYPMVYKGGTSKEALLEQYENAGRAIQTAIRALVGARPHARDFVNADYHAAATEHEARIQALRNVYGEIVAIYNHVDGE